MTNHPLLRNYLPQKSRRGADKKNVCIQRKAGDVLTALQEPTWRGSVADTAICGIFTSCSCITSQAEYSCVGCFPEGFSSRYTNLWCRIFFYVFVSHRNLYLLKLYSHYIDIRLPALILLSNADVVCKIRYGGECLQPVSRRPQGQHEGSYSCVNEV